MSEVAATTSSSSFPRRKTSIADIFFESKEMERGGTDIIHFDVGEPDFPPPANVVEATINAIKSGKSKYTGSTGIAEVRDEIASHVRVKYGVAISPNQVVFTVGGRMALFLAFATLPRGSKVGVISPDWPAYRDLCEFFSLQTRSFETRLEDDWDIDLSKIEESDCNALAINYPNNPTGKILDETVFQKLIEIASRKRMKIISDEVYSDYILGKTKFKSLLEAGISSERIFTTSLSKSYSMTGFRTGYLISDTNTATKLAQMNALLLTSAPEFVQYGAIAALKSQEYVKEKVELIRERKNLACRTLRDFGFEFYPPDGSLYVFPKLNSQNSGVLVDSEQFALRLLRKGHVSVTPGTVFGEAYSQYVRITLLQSSERIVEGIRRMSESL